MAKKRAIDPAQLWAADIVSEVRKAGRAVVLREAAERVRSGITETELREVLGQKVFKTAIVLAFPDELDSLVAPSDELDWLAGDEQVLRGVCERMCSPLLPTLDLAMGKKLLATKLHKPFVTAWEKRLAAGELPAFVRAVILGKGKKVKPSLHDVRFPLPWVSLAERVVRELERRRSQGELLVEWSALMLAVGASDPGILQQAHETEPLKSRVVPVWAKEPEGLVVLVDDLERAVGDSRILDSVLTAALKPGDSMADLEVLKKQKLLHPSAGTAFIAALTQHQVSGCWPSGFGLGRNAKKAWLFRLRDVQGLPMSATTAPGSIASPTVPHLAPRPTGGESQGGFAREFAETFDRLDRSHGGRNFVKLSDLRRELPNYSRETFDSELRHLRIAKTFRLSTSDGNHVTLTPEERAAGIQEADLLLVYCERIH